MPVLRASPGRLELPTRGLEVPAGEFIPVHQHPKAGGITRVSSLLVHHGIPESSGAVVSFVVSHVGAAQ